jgi:hypothetical protein
MTAKFLKRVGSHEVTRLEQFFASWILTPDSWILTP